MNEKKPPISAEPSLAIAPTPDDPSLSVAVEGIDQTGAGISSRVVNERPLTLFLNRQEIVTMMTIGDHPELLAIGYLRNQNMLRDDDVVTAIEHDEEVDAVVVRTERETDYEDRLQKKVRTSGCAQGTIYGDIMTEFEDVRLAENVVLRTSWLYRLTKRINTIPSLYLAAGAIHGAVLCRRDQPVAYMEDVGRHNAVDKIAGYMWMKRIAPDDLIFYTTGRLTSEMVIKTVMMRIPVLISRSGFTAYGVTLARKAGLTLIGRARGHRFVCLSGAERLVFDAETRSSQGKVAASDAVQ